VVRQLESIAEVHVLEIGEIEESLLDTDTLGLAGSILEWDFDPSVLAELLLLFFSGSGSLHSITLFVTLDQEPAEEQDDNNLAAVRGEEDRPWDTISGLVLVLPPLRSNYLTDGVPNEPHSVVSEFLGVSGCGCADP